MILLLPSVQLRVLCGRRRSTTEYTELHGVKITTENTKLNPLSSSVQLLFSLCYSVVKFPHLLKIGSRINMLIGHLTNYRKSAYLNQITQ